MKTCNNHYCKKSNTCALYLIPFKNLSEIPNEKENNKDFCKYYKHFETVIRAM